MSLRNRIIGYAEVDPASAVLNSRPGLGFAMARTTQGNQVGQGVGGSRVVPEQAEGADVVDMSMSRVVWSLAARLARTSVTLKCRASCSPPSRPIDSGSAQARGIGAIPRPTDSLGETFSGTEYSVGGFLAPYRWENIDGLQANHARCPDGSRRAQSHLSGALGRTVNVCAAVLGTLPSELRSAAFALECLVGVCGALVLGVLTATVNVVVAELIKAPAVDQHAIPAECARRRKHVVDTVEIWIGRVIAYVARMRVLYLAPAPAHAKLRFSIHPSILGDCL